MPSSASKRRLTIAKELFAHGFSHSRRNSPSDAILAILDFDYCVETLLKTVLIDNNISLRNRRSPKSFDDLIQDVTNIYPQVGYVSEVLSLHKLRNDVQHHCLIPSKQEVERHVITARTFFDEICSKPYDSHISYSDISLGLFITSEIEKIILKELEKAFDEQRHSDSAFYAKQVVSYHVELLRKNMNVPYSWHSSFLYSHFSGEPFGDLGDFIRETDEKLDWIVDRLCLRDHYDDVNGMLGRMRDWIQTIPERDVISQDSAEKARNLAYDFLTRTQYSITEVDLEKPIIFDINVLEKSEDRIEVEIGIASAFKIEEAKLFVRDGPEQIFSKVLTPEIGMQSVEINGLQKGNQYFLNVIAKSEKDQRDDKCFKVKL